MPDVVLGELLPDALEGPQHLLVHRLVVIKEVVLSLVSGEGLTALRTEVVVGGLCLGRHGTAYVTYDLSFGGLPSL